MVTTKEHLLKIAKHAEIFALRLSPDDSELIAMGPSAALETAHALINMHFIKAPHFAQVAKANSLQMKMMDANSADIKGVSVVFQVTFSKPCASCAVLPRQL